GARGAGMWGQARRRLIMARSNIEGGAGAGGVSAMRPGSPEWSAGRQPSADLIEFRYVEAGAPSPVVAGPLSTGAIVPASPLDFTTKPRRTEDAGSKFDSRFIHVHPDSPAFFAILVAVRRHCWHCKASADGAETVATLH